MAEARGGRHSARAHWFGDRRGCRRWFGVLHLPDLASATQGQGLRDRRGPRDGPPHPPLPRQREWSLWRRRSPWRRRSRRWASLMARKPAPASVGALLHSLPAPVEATAPRRARCSASWHPDRRPLRRAVHARHLRPLPLRRRGHLRRHHRRRAALRVALQSLGLRGRHELRGRDALRPRFCRSSRSGRPGPPGPTGSCSGTRTRTSTWATSSTTT